MNVASQPSDCNKNITYMNGYVTKSQPASKRASEREQQWKCEKKSHKNIISCHEKHIYVVEGGDIMGVIKSRNGINWH